MQRQRLYNLLTVALLLTVTVGGLIYTHLAASAYVERIVVGLGISIILVVSLNLSNGFTGVFSLGHVGFMAIGAYTAAILTLPLALKRVNLPDLPGWLATVQLPFLPATLIGALLAMIIALLVGLSLMRLSGPYVAVATLGFLVIVQVVLVNWASMTRGSRTFSGVPPHTTLWWVWVWASVTVYAIWRLVRSSYGRRMMAIRDNEIAAQSLGISVVRSRLIAFCVSAFFTAVAGSLWAHFIMSFSPKAFYFVETFSIITMLVIGGSGSVSGSIVGAVFITVLSEVLRNAERGISIASFHIPPVYGASQILVAIVFIVVIIFWPKGLLGDREIDFNRLWSLLLPPQKTKRRTLKKEAQKNLTPQDKEKAPMKTRSHLMTLAFTVLLAGALVALTTPAAAESVKIGALYNLTGGMASLDVPASNGAKLAAKEINAAGGVLGRELELVMYDGKTDAATIGNAATQLIESDKAVIMIGFTDSDMTLAAAPIAAKAGIVFLTSGATSPRLPEQVPDYLYMACFGDNVQAAAGAEFAYNALKARTSYLLIDKGMEYTLGLGKYFKERFIELGGKIVLEDTYQTGDTDYSAQITKLKRLGTLPDILFISAGPDEVGVIVKQFRESGIEKPIFGGDGDDTPLLVQIAGKGADNTYFSTHSLMDAELGTDAVKRFIAAYQSEYKAPPENAFAGLGYDTVKLLADAIKRAGSDDPQAIREALQKTKNLPGVTGVITYQPGSRIPQKGVTMILVKDGKFTLAAEVVPEKVPAP